MNSFKKKKTIVSEFQTYQKDLKNYFSSSFEILAITKIGKRSVWKTTDDPIPTYEFWPAGGTARYLEEKKHLIQF